MKLELVFFRLMLLVGFASAICFGGLAAYNTKQAGDWRVQADALLDGRPVSLLDCYLSQDRLPGCAVANRIQAEAVGANQNWYQANERAKRYGLLAVGVPLVLALLFYALRWALTGRVRPLRPTP